MWQVSARRGGRTDRRVCGLHCALLVSGTGFEQDGFLTSLWTWPGPWAVGSHWGVQSPTSDWHHWLPAILNLTTCDRFALGKNGSCGHAKVDKNYTYSRPLGVFVAQAWRNSRRWPHGTHTNANLGQCASAGGPGLLSIFLKHLFS